MKPSNQSPEKSDFVCLCCVQANMGVTVKFLDPAEQAAAAVAAQQTVGHFRDAQAITDFAAGCDVLTVEIEHINADAMEAAGKACGVDVEPTPSTLRIIQVRRYQFSATATAHIMTQLRL
jgi:phosphoribosylaminoimidazole carboxylase